MIELKEIEKIVSEYLEVYDLGNVTKKRRFSFARSIYFKLSKDFTAFSLREIGSSVNRKHCTVINGINKFKNEIDQNHFVFYKKAYEQISLNIEEIISDRIRKEGGNKKLIDNVNVLEEIYSLPIQDIKDFEEVARDFLYHRNRVLEM